MDTEPYLLNSPTMKTLILTFLATSAVVWCVPLNAQFINMSPVPMDSAAYVGLKYSGAMYKASAFGENPDGASGVYKMYGVFPLNSRLHLNAEIPFVVARQGTESESGLGNIYIGLQETLGKRRRSNLSFGLYLPTIGSEKYIRQDIGNKADPYGFLHYADGFSIRANLATNWIRPNGVMAGFEIGPDVFIATDSYGGATAFLHFAAKAGYHFDAIAVWAEWNGITALPWGMNNILVFGGQLSRSRFRPGIFYGIYLDRSFKERISGLLEIKMEVLVRK
jgi:hypothetical protein